MKMNYYLVVVIIACTLLILYWMLYYYRKRKKLITTTYRVRIGSEKESIALITYQSAKGIQKIWLYEKEWEITIELPGERKPMLMVSARYLERENTPSNEEGKDRPLVSGKIECENKVLREENKKMVSLEFPY